MKSKKGISLIVLIVTIIVTIILAAAVILTMNNNNPIESAKDATFKSDMANVQEELSMYISKQYTDNNGNYDPTTLNLSGDDMVSKLPSTKKYKDKISVEKGKLVFTSTNVTDENVPIPTGFTYVEGTKNTGVVIQDSNGNQFVWVPVDGTNVKYQKDNTFPGTNANNTVDDTLPNGVSDETSDVTKYGGFYIGRYEAGVPDNQTTIDGNLASTSNTTGIPTSKKGKASWTFINYTNSKENAKNMYNTSTSVKSGLLTGKAWDTTCNWLKSTGTNISDSRAYGNYNNSISPANVNGYGSKQVTGYSDKWSVNNIYDLAGNVWEWTAEAYSSYGVYRGGSYGDLGGDRPVSFRNNNVVSVTNVFIGFRVRLYIL